MHSMTNMTEPNWIEPRLNLTYTTNIYSNMVHVASPHPWLPKSPRGVVLLRSTTHYRRTWDTPVPHCTFRSLWNVWRLSPLSSNVSLRLTFIPPDTVHPGCQALFNTSPFILAVASPGSQPVLNHHTTFRSISKWIKQIKFKPGDQWFSTSFLPLKDLIINSGDGEPIAENTPPHPYPLASAPGPPIHFHSWKRACLRPHLHHRPTHPFAILRKIKGKTSNKPIVTLLCKITHRGLTTRHTTIYDVKRSFALTPLGTSIPKVFQNNSYPTTFTHKYM